MSVAAADAVPVDAEGERCSLLADPARAAGALQRGLPGFASGELTIAGCRVVQARHRTSPGARAGRLPLLAISYELDVRDREGRDLGSHRVHARAYADGAGARQFRRAAGGPLVPSRVGPPIAHLADLETVVWGFPNDPRLPHLAEAVDPQRVVAHLPYDRLPAGFRSADEIASVDVEIVRYKAEVRCTARYGLTSCEPGAGKLVLFGKTFKHAVAEEMARRIAAVAAGLGDDDAGFTVPELLGFSAPARTIWQAALPGAPVLEVLDARSCAGFAAAAGRGLARLQRVPLDGLPFETPAGRLAPVGEQVAEIAAVFPAFAVRLNRLRGRLEDTAPPAAAAPAALVHGDFLFKQLVAADGRLGVFDFDDFVSGDPLQDLACFVIDEARNLRYERPGAAAVPRMTRAFLDAYRAAVPWDVPDARLRWHAGVQAMRDMYYWFKRAHPQPGFERELDRMLRLAEDPPIPLA